MISYGSMSVLVVEDQPTTRKVVRKLLEQIGFGTIDVTFDGARALAMAQEKTYDLILSDLHMGAGGGLQLLRAVRGDTRLKNVYFMVMSVDMTMNGIRAACLAGADAYMLKPYGAAALKSKMEAMFRERALRRCGWRAPRSGEEDVRISA